MQDGVSKIKLKCVFKRGKYTVRKEEVLKENLQTWVECITESFWKTARNLAALVMQRCVLLPRSENRHRILSKHSPLCTSTSGNVPFKGWASNWSKNYCTAVSSELKHALLGREARKTWKANETSEIQEAQKDFKAPHHCHCTSRKHFLGWGNAASAELAASWAGSLRDATLGAVIHDGVRFQWWSSPRVTHTTISKPLCWIVWEEGTSSD